MPRTLLIFLMDYKLPRQLVRQDTYGMDCGTSSRNL